MNYIVWTTLLALTVLIASCNVPAMQKELYGTWSIEKVTLNGSNIRDSLNDVKLTFWKNRTVSPPERKGHFLTDNGGRWDVQERDNKLYLAISGCTFNAFNTALSIHLYESSEFRILELVGDSLYIKATSFKK